MKWLLTAPFWIIIYVLLLVFSFNQLLFDDTAYDQTVLGSENTVKTLEILPTGIILPSSIKPSQDIRITALQKFFYAVKSPLLDYAQYMVKTADSYSLDYALVPAISMQESHACKRIPLNSYNCWGFGIYGSQITRFNSFEEGINSVSKTIKEAYIKNGLSNPTLLEDKWTPSSRGTWSYAVNYYIIQIHNLEKNTTAS